MPCILGKCNGFGWVAVYNESGDFLGAYDCACHNWHEIKSAPKHKNILLWSRRLGVCEGYWAVGDKPNSIRAGWHTSNHRRCSPTHWTDLPMPPGLP